MLIATPEASPKYDDSYMGYSVTVGDFVGHGIQGVAVGVPRGASLKGLVSSEKQKKNLFLLDTLLGHNHLYYQLGGPLHT